MYKIFYHIYVVAIVGYINRETDEFKCILQHQRHTCDMCGMYKSLLHIFILLNRFNKIKTLISSQDTISKSLLVVRMIFANQQTG